MSASRLEVRKCALIGAGNMAEALVNGLIRGGVCSPRKLVVADIRAERVELFEKEFGVSGVAHSAEAAKDADVVVLAVKPQAMDDVLNEIRGSLAKSALIISIAAGVRTSRIEQALGPGVRVVRVMPNTPALVRSGAAAVCGGRWATEQDLQAAELMMGAAGVVARVREEDMDAVTALSGSGPAYVFYLVEAMLEAAKRLGLNEAVSKKLIYATVEGAAKLMAETGLEASELRRRVTSKGGTTAAALEVLGNRKVAEAWVEAIEAAHRRAHELSGS